MHAILIMQSGSEFIARPHTVGTSDEELTAIKAGTVDAARLAEVQTCLTESAFMLQATAIGSKH